MVLFLYGKIRVYENLYSHMFYAESQKQLQEHFLKKYLQAILKVLFGGLILK